MNNRNGRLGAVLVLLTAGVAQAAPSPWPAKMRDMEKTLQELLVDVSSDERFNAKSNFKRIEKNVERFAKLTHALEKPAPTSQGGSPDGDPSIAIIAERFSEEADHVLKSLQLGQRAYARNVLRSMMGYCIACHTRSGSGPSFPTLSSHPTLQALQGLEKADYLASTRQFDRALEEYERLISEPTTAEHRPFDWERALRTGLAIAVRVKKDPDRALSIVSRVLAEPRAPFFIKEQALQWRNSIQAWKSEKPGKAMTEDGYYAQAMRLIADAKAMQKYPADRSADILYLRASSAAHDLLTFAPNGPRAAEGLYLAGMAYEVLRDLNLWDVHSFYYLACITRAPHTETARRCYRHYEESAYLGYTGSGGTHLPQEMRNRLKRLDLLSSPKSDPLPAPGTLR